MDFMRNNVNFLIIIPGQTQYLNLIGKLCVNIVKGLYLEKTAKESLTQNINTVLTESIVNSIKHGGAHSLNNKIRITIKINKNVLTISVFDNGQGFDLYKIPKKTLGSDLLKERGRGIHIIRTLMDSVVYRKSVKGNLLEMKITII